MQSEGSPFESPTKGVSSPSYGESDYSGDSQYVTKEGYITIKVKEGTLENSFSKMKSDLEAEGATLGDVIYTEYSDRMQYSLSVKISPSKFDSVSGLLKEVGDVKSMSVQLEDVTKRYVELDTRIENREIELERLYELYNMSDNVSDLLQVENLSLYFVNNKYNAYK